MKKALSIIFALGFVLVFTNSNAQAVTKVFKFENLSPIINSGTITATQVISLTTDSLTVVASVVRNSGTLGGTVVVQGSIDNSNWTTVTGGGASQTFSDAATGVKWFYLAARKYYYYRVLFTGTGTMNATPKVYFMPK